MNTPPDPEQIETTGPGGLGSKVAAVILGVGAIGVVLASHNIKYAFASDPLGPKAFPMGIAIGLFICAAWYLFSPGQSQERSTGKVFNRVVICIAMLIACFALLDFLGFIVTMGLLCAGIAFLFGATPIMSLLSGAIQAVGWWVLFGPLLSGTLPTGFWPKLFS